MTRRWTRRTNHTCHPCKSWFTSVTHHPSYFSNSHWSRFMESLLINVNVLGVHLRSNLLIEITSMSSQYLPAILMIHSYLIWTYTLIPSLRSIRTSRVRDLPMDSNTFRTGEGWGDEGMKGDIQTLRMLIHSSSIIPWIFFWFGLRE